MLTTTRDDVDVQIRSTLAEYGRLSVDAMSYDARADLYDAGMTSHATVNVMLGLEGVFDCEFPDAMLNRRVFSSVASIRDALAAIGQTSSGS